MNRRDLLKIAAAVPFLPAVFLRGAGSFARAETTKPSAVRSRVRPGDPSWPSASAWNGLKQDVGGRLLKVQSPFADRAGAGSGRDEALGHLANPFYIGDQPGLTQTSGWLGAWTSRPSVYAVAAERTADVVAAVNFARNHNLRLVIKGGGHSYQGTSDAPNSLLVWTRHMNRVTLHEAFVAEGCIGIVPPQPAVTVEAGAMWIDAYDAVTTQGGRYVQGGGCTTVGVAGLIQSGGFGSFSKAYGTAAAGLLEAEIVTADGVTRIANARTHPDLFWGIKGGGGGSLGVVTRLTLRTRELPKSFGAVIVAIKASSEHACHALIAKAISFYQSALLNPHWGEQMRFRSDGLSVLMTFQGLEQQQAREIWAPFLDWVAARQEYSMASPAQFVVIPARHFWDADYLRRNLPGIMIADDRPGAAAHHVRYADNSEEVGWFIHGYQSAWLPASLLSESQQPHLVDALFECTRHWMVELHFNKGLAGAPPGEIDAAGQTATNPKMLDAFALAICAGGGPAAYPGMPNATAFSALVKLASGRTNASKITRAMNELLKVAPAAGSYVAESDYFTTDWQTAFWGTNYPRLAAVKNKYDPEGLFCVRHGVGSERWSEDGFTQLER